MNTTISISKAQLLALWIGLVMLLLAVLFLLLKPEKRQDVLFTAIVEGNQGDLPEGTITSLENSGFHTIIGLNAEREIRFFEASTGNEIDVCDANAGNETNTLTNQKTNGSESAANERCQLSAGMLQQLLSCPSNCTTKCNVSGSTVCAHSAGGKKYRGCHGPAAQAPQGGHTECQ